MRVVHVDDNSQILDYYGQAITAAGFNHFPVNDPKVALDTIHQVQPRAVILDVVMPEVNGIELLRAIKHEPALNQIPVIFLTNMPYELTGEAAQAGGAYGYLSKRYYTPEMVVTVLRPLLLEE